MGGVRVPISGDAAGGRACRIGASYKQLALAAHLAGLSKKERAAWYKVAEAVPLSQLHAGHLITRLQQRAA